jgi:thiosulfate/3-mercaptopyruvate sulfurtransferase
MSKVDYLVSTQWLNDHLWDENLRILDVTAMLTKQRENRARQDCYDDGHIPNAVLFDVASGDGVLSDPNAALPWTWPTVDQFTQTMHDYGIDNETRVIIVAKSPREGIDSGTMWCTRAWWTMHHFGVDVAILKGGVERWCEEGRELVTDSIKDISGDTFTVDDNWQRGYADKQAVLAGLDNATCLIDSLSSASFDGSREGYGSRNGHITGAINIPFSELVNGETADFRSEDELAEILSGALQEPRVITYCGAAIAATVDAFALKLLGHQQVAVYDGSLLEWTSDASLPMTDPSAAP